MWKYAFFALLAFNIYRYAYPATQYNACMTIRGKVGVFCVPYLGSEKEINEFIAKEWHHGDDPRVDVSVVKAVTSGQDLIQYYNSAWVEQKMKETFR